MKKIGIISDIHSNKEALYQVLLDMEKRGIDEIVCLGDMITKYIYPRQVVDTLKSECKILIKGNCDDNVVKNAFKFEKFIFDGFSYFDDLLLYRIDKEKEFAPIKSQTGPNSLEEAIKKYEKYYH